ncbi:flagellar basal body P-ring formation chaperone FlgA [Asticcacaulis taihuensis]|uniref:Flagella basal body P-ring formation protein FlgA n=1 Tax=Asticcacaulis taihuensis TaxID=260084 RepID=A0A1G4QNP9_9CAUL|nr:flagellar basal body P-ring formation chaperone FlgA [Asticcacaulis taihuensis]SCW45958.1 flagella basal body P-ring formation protein FlgA [Asticcacaulis taihuensis]
MKVLAALSVILLAVPALANAQTSPAPLVLKSSVTDGDGRITLGDVFDNAGQASDVLLGYRQGSTAVLDAAIVQSIAARNGAYWDNARGLRRIIVAAGPETSSGNVSGNAQQLATITGTQSPANWGQPALSGPVAVKRSEMVSVTWTQNGLSLTLSGPAQKDGAIGDVIQVQNPSSKKMIDAVVTGPGRAVSGQAATQIRNQTFLSSR